MKFTVPPFPPPDDKNQVIPLPPIPHATGEEFIAALLLYDQLSSDHIHGLDQLLPVHPVQTLTPTSSSTMEHQCQLGPGCTVSLEDTITSISHDLHLHNHVHKQFEPIYCPWTGCDDEMLWRNVARHVKEKHRQKCLSRCALVISRAVLILSFGLQHFSFKLETVVALLTFVLGTLRSFQMSPRLVECGLLLFICYT